MGVCMQVRTWVRCARPRGAWSVQEQVQCGPDAARARPARGHEQRPVPPHAPAGRDARRGAGAHHSAKAADQAPHHSAKAADQPPHHFAEVVDQARRRHQVHRRQAVGAGRVVMVAVDGEHGQPDIKVGVLEVCGAGEGVGRAGVNKCVPWWGMGAAGRVSVPEGAPSRGAGRGAGAPQAQGPPSRRAPPPLPRPQLCALASPSLPSLAHPLTKLWAGSLRMRNCIGSSPRQYLRSSSTARTSVGREGLLSWNRSPPSSSMSTWGARGRGRGGVAWCGRCMWWWRCMVVMALHGGELGGGAHARQAGAPGAVPGRVACMGGGRTCAPAPCATAPAAGLPQRQQTSRPSASRPSPTRPVHVRSRYCVARGQCREAAGWAGLCAEVERGPPRRSSARGAACAACDSRAARTSRPGP